MNYFPRKGVVTNYQGTITQSNTSYRYDVLNQMTGTTTSAGLEITYGYNGEGKRILKTSNGKTVRYLYEGDKVILEVDGTGVEKARSVIGINQISRTIGGEVLYYLYNGHADVTQLTNTLGKTVATYYYDAFGEIIDSSGSADNPIRYAGYQYDEETGLYYLNARMYDPTIARFLQEDTYTGDKNDPLSLNLYAYCMNNPMIYNDPTGHFFKELWNGAKEAASDFVETVDSTVDAVVNYIDTKVEEACTHINDKVDEGFNYVESKFNISDSTPIYGAIKNDIKQKIGFVEGAYEEAISMVTGIASLLVKNNPMIKPIRTFNNIANMISDPESFMDKASDTFDKAKTIYDIANHPEQLFTNPTAIKAAISINNYGKELEADPYKRGNLAGHAAVFVASFFVGAGEAKTAITAEKGLNAALKAEKELNALSKVEEGINGLSKAELALSKSVSKTELALSKGAAEAETTRVGQWMSKPEYEQFVKTGEIPRTNVLTKGKEGYMKQANVGDYYTEFDINSSLLVEKDANLGWSLVKSKNSMYLKLAEKKGTTLPDPFGINIEHLYTK